MADLRELTTDAKRLYEAMDELLEKQDETKSEDIDFKEIWFGAKSRTFQGHIVEKLDEYEADRYLKILSAMTALAEETNRKTIQIRFLARVLAARKNPKWTLADLVSDGKMLQEKTLDEIQKLEREEVRVSLIVDLLIMIYLDGVPEERQLDYVVGLMALFGWKKEKTKAIGMIVKGILEQDDDAIVAQHNKVDITDVYCYMKNVPDGRFVTDFELAKNTEANKIIFKDLEWNQTDVVNLDLYKAEIIEFQNCKFKKLMGMYNSKKTIVLTDCAFEDCEVEENFLCLNNVVMERCRFARIKSIRTISWHLFAFLNAKIKNVRFEDILIKHMYDESKSINGEEYGYGGFIKAKDSLICDIDINNLTTKWIEMESSRPEYYYKRVIDIYGGRIVNWKIDECSLACYSQLFTFSEGTIKEEINVDHCNVHVSYESNWGGKKDISFEEMFKVKKV